jgi:hypothetical protein
MQRVTQWNLDFMDHSEQGDRWEKSPLFLRFSVALLVWCGGCEVAVVSERKSLAHISLSRWYDEEK